MVKEHNNFRMLVDWSGGWATPGGLAFQMRPWSEACRVKRLIERPPESAQLERKSTPRYGDKTFIGGYVWRNGVENLEFTKEKGWKCGID